MAPERFWNGSVGQSGNQVRIGSIVMLCFEWARACAFWQTALGYEIAHVNPAGDFMILRDPAGRGPNLSLDKVPGRREGKRSRLHLDLYTHDQAGEVGRLVRLGATRYPWRYPEGADYVVLADPDDNLFCVVQSPGQA